MKLLDDEGLRQKGIKFSRAHRHRLVSQGKFPAPVKLGENTNAWLEDEIDVYLAERIAARSPYQPAAPRGRHRVPAQ